MKKVLVSCVYNFSKWTEEEKALFAILAGKVCAEYSLAVQISEEDKNASTLLAPLSMLDIKAVLDSLLKKGVRGEEVYDDDGEQRTFSVSISLAEYAEYRVKKDKATGAESHSVGVVFSEKSKNFLQFFACKNTEEQLPSASLLGVGGQETEQLSLNFGD